MNGTLDGQTDGRVPQLRPCPCSTSPYGSLSWDEPHQETNPIMAVQGMRAFLGRLPFQEERLE